MVKKGKEIRRTWGEEFYSFTGSCLEVAGLSPDFCTCTNTVVVEFDSISSSFCLGLLMSFPDPWSVGGLLQSQLWMTECEHHMFPFNSCQSSSMGGVSLASSSGRHLHEGMFVQEPEEDDHTDGYRSVGHLSARLFTVNLNPIPVFMDPRWGQCSVNSWPDPHTHTHTHSLGSQEISVLNQYLFFAVRLRH